MRTSRSFRSSYKAEDARMGGCLLLQSLDYDLPETGCEKKPYNPLTIKVYTLCFRGIFLHIAQVNPFPCPCQAVTRRLGLEHLRNDEISFRRKDPSGFGQELFRRMPVKVKN